MSDYYEVLGVSRQATTDEIKRAYKKKARRLHPDVAGPGHEDEFKAINVAYEVLADSDKRQMYDLGGEEAVHADGGFNAGGFGAADFGGFGDFLQQAFFGGGAASRGPASRARRGQDSLVALEVDLTDVAFGATKSLPVDTYVTCGTCGGSCCAERTSPVTCSQCDGRGSVQRVQRSFLGNVVTSSPCSRCQGFGTVIASPCRDCDGEGRRHVRTAIDVNIPAGVSTGTRIRMSGRGEAGPAGGPSGDLYVEIHEKHDDSLSRTGDDLYTELRVPMTAAALGASFPLSTLDGERIVSVKPGTQGGDEVVLSGLGVGRLRRSGRGDLHVQIVVETPSGLDDRQRQLLTELASLRGEDGFAPARDESLADKVSSRFKGGKSRGRKRR